ncbi:PREDICTED: uncharacterized protein LOC108613365 isoform X2 [Drosophila arizonae]|uniref:Uncharacterized protein LOC108613365 isoform X1 n=1 Tax=Drosophila arizonae TaxID=7263 RepID=A0ABM1P4W9_DROAR|nr:PREDICTED: uncharacterized protein LOC108613365 isoform X1 [Drosophila arizonae]XP_017862256.1 PREDICTED: uncharacterized protein LOC108613365 isoform X2 [Drosophila arizonae]
MAFKRCLTLLLLVSCLAALVTARLDFPEAGPGSPRVRIIRSERTPQRGSVVVTASKDQSGRQAGVQYNHNLYTSRDGRGRIDAYANANRNFDQNRNNFGGGVQGSWRF